MTDEIGKDASKLVKDLSYIPTIIGAMGENIAEAQQKLNADYVRTLALVSLILGRMAQSVPDDPSDKDQRNAYIKKKQDEAIAALGDNPTEQEKEAARASAKTQADAFLDSPAADPAARDQSLNLMLKSFAPSLYQFTESTLDFSADFSQTSNTAISAGFGGGLFGFTISAGLSMAYGYDYRAAGRITSVLHAIRPDTQMGEKLLERSKAIIDTKPTLPGVKAVDAVFLTEAVKAFEKMTGIEVDDDDVKAATD